MAVVPSGKITQSADAITLTFTDTSTGITGLVSRTLVITDSNAVVLATIAMGSATSATYIISSDVYLTFAETIVDSTGTYIATVNYSSIQFYNIAQAGLAADITLPCHCDTASCSSLVKARECINAALTYTLIGDGQSAQKMLTAADYYINNPVYA